MYFFEIFHQYFIFSGFEVTAFVRDSSRLSPDVSYRVNVAQGDVTNPQDVDDAVAGQDAVIIVLGTGRDTSKDFS